MVKYFIWILFWVTFSFATIINGQGISNIWMGGYSNSSGAPPWGGWKMDFNTGTPTISYELRNMNMNMTCATISDTVGNFLFATNGVIVMNSAGDTMQNGSGLNPSLYSSPQWFGDGLRIPQGALILPLPETTNLFYIFHMTWDIIAVQPYATQLYYTVIDMNLDGGKGAVISKNNIAFTDSLSSNGISACKHANGRDWWVNIHDSFGSDFHLFLFTTTGVVYDHSQTFGYRDGVGTYGFSPDGTKFGGYNTVDDFEIFDFDRCSGTLSNYRQVAISDSMVWFGSAFSPNSKYLYGSSLNYLYQVDVTSNQPDTTLITVDIWDGTYYGSFQTEFGLPQIRPDGKIYVTTGSVTPLMHLIEYPDSAGVSCNVIQRADTLPSYNRPTVPNHPNYFLGALTGSPCDSLTSTQELNSGSPIQLKVFPNPATSNNFEITYSLEQNKIGNLEILNSTGQVVFKKTLPQWSTYQKLNTPELSNGIYLMRLRSGNKTAMFKFVKQVF